MVSDAFDSETVARYWLTESDEALIVAGHLIEKADYSYALFFGHLAVEKMLKGLHAIKKGQHAPPIHNLLRLAKAVDIELDASHTEALLRITAFNIEARYPDLKQGFRQRCTPEYAAEQMKTITEMCQWLRSNLTS
jgi:HEPN domain-containing protein